MKVNEFNENEINKIKQVRRKYFKQWRALHPGYQDKYWLRKAEKEEELQENKKQ